MIRCFWDRCLSGHSHTVLHQRTEYMADEPRNSIFLPTPRLVHMATSAGVSAATRLPPVINISVKPGSPQRTHFWLPHPAGRGPPSTVSQEQGHTGEAKVHVRKMFPKEATPCRPTPLPRQSSWLPKSLPAVSCPSLGQTHNAPNCKLHTSPKTQDTGKPVEWTLGNCWKATGSH